MQKATVLNNYRYPEASAKAKVAASDDMAPSGQYFRTGIAPLSLIQDC